MEDRTKEIVAIAASVAGHCQPCLKYHLGRARQLGISEDDVKEAIRLAKVISENGDKRMIEFAELLMADESEIHLGQKARGPQTKIR
jgi:AhpD family alkylhydroperoxidase